jgi:Fibronectin type III domain
MISQLPAAAAVTAADAIPISQGGATRSISVGSLLAQSQPAIMVPSPSLLGRVSLGSGGPEAIAIGSGLILAEGTLATEGLVTNGVTAATTLSATDQLIIASGSSHSTVPASAIRTLFTAGTNISINQAGVISANGTSSASGTLLAFSSLPTTGTATSADLIPINQNGTVYAISYANLINGETIDKAQAADTASDSDSFWVSQGGNAMARQNLTTLWTWIVGKVPSIRLPVVEIATNTVFDATVHNGRILVCSAPVSLSAVALNMGSGFTCDIINLSNGTVTFGPEIFTTNGTGILSPGQSALVRCVIYSAGTTVHALISGSSTTPAVPGTVTGLVASNITANSLTLTWTTPTSGAVPTGFAVQIRTTGTTTWTVIAQDTAALTLPITGLSASTSYDIVVIASNASGSGIPSASLTVATTATTNVPGQVGNLTVVAQSSSSITASWNAPTSGSTPILYTIQYRTNGSTSWVGSIANVSTTSQTISGLTPVTAYDVAVIASNAAGPGPISSIATCTTTHQAGAVTSIIWNIAPSGSYSHGSGSIGVNVHVNPPSAAVQFGFSTSATTPPSTWTAAIQVNTDLWGAYISVPSTAGQYYAWASGTDGSCQTVYQPPITVT